MGEGYPVEGYYLGSGIGGYSYDVCLCDLLQEQCLSPFLQYPQHLEKCLDVVSNQ